MKRAFTSAQLSHASKLAWLSSLVGLIAFAAFATNALLRQKRDFNGTLQIQICRKAAIGLGKKPLDDFIVVSRVEGTITAK